MASIFLSYAREDLDVAERIANILQDIGHSVWWDRELQTGTRFTAEIDRALKEAEAVVVLWSKHSIVSAWVQDEAAVGREAGRLFPALVESVQPPLGFRQFEAADLSGWSGRRRSRAFAKLERALAGLPNKDGDPRPMPTVTRNQFPRWVFALLFVSLVAVIGVAAWQLRPGGSSILSIVAARPADNRSNEFAHQVAVDFSRFQPADLGNLIIREEKSESADYQAEIGIVEQAGNTRADISLRLPRHSGLTWADSIEMPAERQIDLRQQATAALATALRCIRYAEKSTESLKTGDFRLFLDGCVVLSSEYSTVASGDQVPLLRKVAANNPNFAPAHALLALALYQVVISSDEEQVQPVIAEARKALARAKQIDPNMEDVYAADSLMHSANSQQWDHAFPILELGLAKHPDSALLLGLRSARLQSVGRMNEAAENARQALQLDPLTPKTRVNYIDALAYSDRYGAADAELKKAEAIWPNSAILQDARYRLDLRYGDPKRALNAVEKGETGDSTAGAESWRRFLRARIDPTDSNVESALESFRERYRRNPADIPGYIQALGIFGRVDEAFEVTHNPITLDSMMASTEVLFRPQMRSLFTDVRFMELANRLGLLDYWRKSGVWPDFCKDPTIHFDCHEEAAKLQRPRKTSR